MTTVTTTLDEIDFHNEPEGDSTSGCHLLHGEQQQDKGNVGAWNLSLSSFLANFTLGYADGLTVPFALTAGLSWLGSSNMVITAGSAEICAGCISMGIGGYLAAKGVRNAEARELATAAAAAAAEAQIERTRNKSRAEGGEEAGQGEEEVQEGEGSHYALVAKYLAPLNLPSHLLAIVMVHATSAGGGSSKSIVATAVQIASSSSGGSNEDASNDGSAEASPVMAGFSVALGYLLGGLLPLFPYFFVDEVKQGLVWSFVVCLVALFGFGFLKELAMCAEQVPFPSQDDYDDYYGAAWDSTGISTGTSLWREWVYRARHVPSEDVRASLWEGVVMAGLGGIAAVAAVLCVMLSQLVVKEPEHGPP